jgi:inactivated superfamily I helicase
MITFGQNNMLQVGKIIREDEHLLNLYNNNSTFHEFMHLLMRNGSDLSTCIDLIANLSERIENKI